MLPAAVHPLTALRAGDAVTLTWTTPTKTTDGVLLTGKHGVGTITAKICRDEVSATALAVPTKPAHKAAHPTPAVAAAPAPPPTPCTAVAQLHVEPGTAGTFRDTLPPALTTGSPRPLRYRIRIVTEKGKEGADADVIAPAGAAPPFIQNLTAQATGGGVLLRWQPEHPSDKIMMRVVRGPVEAATKPAFRATPASPAKSTGQQRNTADTVTSTLLTVNESEKDSGGATDNGARTGVEQSYTVYRTRSVTVGKETLVMESEPAHVTVSTNAPLTAPGVPIALEAVANTLSGAPEIDLVWQPSADGVVAGYLVFRAENDGAMAQLTPQPIRSFSYADKAVRPGSRYRYSVAAVNAQGTAGQHSAEAAETIPQP